MKIRRKDNHYEEVTFDESPEFYIKTLEHHCVFAKAFPKTEWELVPPEPKWEDVTEIIKQTTFIGSFG